MLKYRNPAKCSYLYCKHITHNWICSIHSLNTLNFTPYFKRIKQQKILKSVIKIQAIWKRFFLKRKNIMIISNLQILSNYLDPISLNIIYNDVILSNINNYFPIFRNKVMYLYEFNSLKHIFNENIKEVYTNTDFSPFELKQINIFFKHLNLILDLHNDLTIDEQLISLKVQVFQKLDKVGTYFTVSSFDEIENEKLFSVFNELKNMWKAFCLDNGILESQLFNYEINWIVSKKKIEYKILDTIDKLMNEHLDINLKKMISYIIVGAFAYVCPHIKEIYSDLEFVI